MTSNNNAGLKVILSGGGTLGSVVPLLAIAEMVKEKYPEVKFVWVGTKMGPEMELVAEQKISFAAITSGKLRRYFSLWNFVDIVKIIAAFFQSLIILRREKPQLLISAGGFVSVPLHWAGAVLNIPQWIHQQDVVPGLSNQLMAPFANIITVALQKSLNDFPKRRTLWLGNPVRAAILGAGKAQAMEHFKLKPDLPVVLATGGGTGSARVNQIIAESVQHLEGVCQIIHLVGRERPADMAEHAAELFADYHVYKFFTGEMKLAYAAADLIISRGGFGTLTDMAALHKAGIIIPKPDHQEENVKFLAHENAIEILNEAMIDGLKLAQVIKDLVASPEKLTVLGNRLSAILPPAKKENVLGVFEQLTINN